MKNKKIINAENLSLEEWLSYLKVPKKDRDFEIIDYQFPTDSHLEEYLSTISSRSTKEVKLLITSFLIDGGHLGYDRHTLDWLISLGKEKIDELCDKSLFLTRLLQIGDPRGPWPDMLWVIDLLPHFPREAVSALDSFFQAHCMYFPDGRIHGLGDAKELIRAKYMAHSFPTKQILLELTPYDFELLVAYLYKQKGYEVKVTPRSRDGGYDVVAEKYSNRQHERLHIECKRYDQKIGVDIVRRVLGTLNVTNASKVVIVTSSNFTSPAKNEAFASKRVELLDCDAFDEEMKKNVSYQWANRVSSYLMEMTKFISCVHKVD
ncbi:restriction endonuclease [Vibrio sp. Vb5031]|uniref:restriction endonuclease n=1 Tax=Vibrio TaxID=662 RepID=UPI001BD5708E|nr:MULTISPECIES: restriction endonuclease [Vibrio]EJU9539041.1 restriction endonuclease [Vibrio alginolyticus]ELA8351616.1 restriction endonuclease [Vibrio alginolyticus]ELA8471082.1 restriction endonuclease [Vibrio alginolyticus]MBS9976733.1 restriction endonuclease [Vibrio alginolyticus]MBT0022899.1 restriction endonuclease [Vibrio alginolyticus]